MSDYFYSLEMLITGTNAMWAYQKMIVLYYIADENNA